jgi:hypothetical protein
MEVEQPFLHHAGDGHGLAHDVGERELALDHGLHVVAETAGAPRR